MNQGPDAAVHPPQPTGVVSVPGDQLDSLTRRVHLSGAEWRIMLSILISSRPVSARCVAARLKLDYSLVKRIVRGLVAWRILERTPGGLQFQPDAGRWK
jgi:predicted transcriptional regulator